jgi:hypothetical protein
MSEEEQEIPQQDYEYEVTYKTQDEINMDKIRMLADLGCYVIIDETKTTVISEGGAIYMNMFTEEELLRIKNKILEIVSKL